MYDHACRAMVWRRECRSMVSPTYWQKMVLFEIARAKKVQLLQTLKTDGRGDKSPKIGETSLKCLCSSDILCKNKSKPKGPAKPL